MRLDGHMGFTPRLSRICWLLLACVTPLVTLAFIFRYATDVPYWDAWEATSILFVKFHAGTLGVADFLRFQNEHRILVPQIVGFTLGLLTHWNMWAGFIGAWVFGWVIVWQLWLLARCTGMRMSAWQVAVTAFLVFSPVQHETWILGNLGYQIPLALFLACLLAPRLMRPGRGYGGYVATMLLAAATTFSFGSGLLAWLFGFPTRVAGRRWLTGLWVGAFVLSVALYFHGYAPSPRSPSPLVFVHRPWVAGEYLLAYLGGGFSSDPFNATIVGSVLLAAFCVCAVRLWKLRDEPGLADRAMPWLMLGMFIIGTGGLTAIGRAGFGVEQALATRYILFSAMLPMTLVMLVPP